MQQWTIEMFIHTLQREVPDDGIIDLHGEHYGESMEIMFRPKYRYRKVAIKNLAVDVCCCSKSILRYLVTVSFISVLVATTRWSSAVPQ